MQTDSGQFYGMFEREGIDRNGRHVVFCDTSGQTDPALALDEINSLGVREFTGPLRWTSFDGFATAIQAAKDHISPTSSFRGDE